MTEKLRHLERQKRVAKGASALEDIGGEKGYRAALSHLKGEMPKADFEAIKDMFDQKTVDRFYQDIFDSDLSFFEQVTAGRGLSKLLGADGTGQIPQESELKQLRKIFGKGLVDEVTDKRGVWEKLVQKWIPEAVNLPRSLMSSMELSGLLRQGRIMLSYKPRAWMGAAKESFGFWKSDEIYEAAMKEIRDRNTYSLMKGSGLSLTSLAGETFDLSKREEEFMSEWAQQIPLVGKLVKSSERAYVGFLNKLRADVFDELTEEYMRAGYTPSKSPEVFKRTADMINVFTGRGPVPKNWRVPASTFLYSPRYQMSRLQLLNPTWYARHPTPVRKEAAKAMFRFVGSGMSVMGLAKLAGAKVESDPRSADFGKIRFGNTRISTWAGMNQWIRYTAQLMLGEVKSTTSENVWKLGHDEYPFTSRADWLGHILRIKESPTASLVHDLADGQNVLGEKVTASKALLQRMTPLYLQTLWQTAQQEGYLKAGVAAIPGFFGVGIQTYGGEEQNRKDLPKLPDLSNIRKK